jgi:hypothetical protein
MPPVMPTRRFGWTDHRDGPLCKAGRLAQHLDLLDEGLFDFESCISARGIGGEQLAKLGRRA